MTVLDSAVLTIMIWNYFQIKFKDFRISLMWSSAMNLMPLARNQRCKHYLMHVVGFGIKWFLLSESLPLAFLEIP